MEHSVRAGRAELGFSDLTAAATGLAKVDLFRQEIVAVSPPGTAAGDEVLSARELAGMPLIVTPVGTSTDTSFRLCNEAFRMGIDPRGARGSGFSACRTSRWRPVAVPEAIRPSTSPSYTTVPPCGPAPGPMSTT